MQYLTYSMHSYGLSLHLEGLLDVHQKTFQMQCNETDGDKESWISEQARHHDDDDDIFAMYHTTI